jgi:hypothetical protein
MLIYVRYLCIKYSKLGVLGPSFAETVDEMRSQDENSTQRGNKDPNYFSSLTWSSEEFYP